MTRLHPHSRPAGDRHLVVAALLALVLALALILAACGSGSTETGSATSSTGSSTTTAGDLPDGCEEAPATTAAGFDGGGEIVCESPGDVGSGEVPDTTIPPATVDVPPGTGLVVVTLVGSPCSRSRPEDACIEIAEMLDGTLTFEPLEGQAPVAAATATGATGGTGPIALGPGRWRVTASPAAADRVCDPTDITVVEGELHEVAVPCAAP